ncbi:MAG: 2-oxoacid:acceptor oxidoreductase family protein [Acidobacteriota bacterium]
MPITEIRVAGFGGQGVILCATIIGRAACIHQGGYATMTQNFGPEARGGAASAQIILSGAPILYPYVTRPDVLVAMSQEAYTRFAPELKPAGLLLVEGDLVRISGVPNGIRVHSVPATRLAEEIGKRMVLNVVMVGFFGAVTGLVEPDALRKAVIDSVPAGMRDLNVRAFERGFEYGLSKLAVGQEVELEHHAGSLEAHE